VKPKHLYAGFAVWCVVFFVLVPSIRAQQAIPFRHVGAVHDWSEHQIIFSRNALARYPDLMDREPRLRQQVIERWQSPKWRALLGTTAPPIHPKKSSLERDWNMGVGARLRENAFPAKFSYDPKAPPDCTKDYVVFGLSVVGVDAGQANLVAFNNLYVNDTGTGYCSGDTPNVMFAYNVSTAPGGKVDTSPVPSLDGTQIAFVETVAGNGGTDVFHVLTWTANQGTIGAAFTPTSSQMSSLPFSTNPGTISSPWIDFSGDAAYVGDLTGTVYQITPVFNGTPALTGTPWPVQVSKNYGLTPPVLDSNRGLLMVGSANGNIYQIPISTPLAFTTAPVGTGTSPQIVAPPIVDITNGTTFVVVADNGAGAALYQFQTANLSTLPVIGAIGQGASGGTHLHLFQPAFSNAYFSDPSNGVVSLCGTGALDTTPWQYTFGFAGAFMNPIVLSSRQLSTGTADRCTGWTEFYNPNAGPADTITATSVTNNVLTVTTNNSNLTVGEEVYIQGSAENSLNGQAVVVASLIGSGPTYTGFTASFTASDYSNPSDTGTVSPADTIAATSVTNNVLTVTTNNSNLTVGEEVYIQGTDESFLNGQAVVVASLLGSGPTYTGFTASFTNPDYSNPSDIGAVSAASAGTDFFFFGLTGDCTFVSGGPPNGCVVAMGNNAGTITTTVAPVNGGPSGIVVDNYSTAAEASSIYLGSLSAATVYKFTQEGLQ